MIGSTDKSVHKRKWEVDGRFLYHELLIQSIAVHFKSDARLSIFDDVATATREAFGDVRQDPCRSGILVSVPMVANEEEGDWDSGDMM